MSEAPTRPQLHVTHVQRLPHPGNFSVEQIFANVRAHMPLDIDVSVAILPRRSQGFWPRMVNMWSARRRQHGIAHVTGDVHYVTALMRPRDTMLTILDLVPLHRRRGLRRTLMLWAWYRIPVARASVVTTISGFIREEVIAATGCAPDKVHVVHVPTSDRFRPIPRRFRAADPRILMIGTAWNKNFARQIEALAGLPCEVAFVGRLSEEHEAALAAHGISYRAHRDLTDDEMMQQYVDCDVLLFASTYEGFGMPIVEANAVGRPVVTSRTASMPEVAGDAACLVDPHDVASIRAGLERVLHDGAYRDALVERGYLNARRFTAALAAERYAALYRAMRARA